MVKGKDPGAFYKVGWINYDKYDKKKLTSSTFRFHGEDLKDFLDAVNGSSDNLKDDEGIQLTFSLKTTNGGESYAGRTFVKSYEYVEYDPEGQGNGGQAQSKPAWKARSPSQKERSRIKEHSINDGGGYNEEETNEEAVSQRQPRSRQPSQRRA